ncbi:type I-C CRISPR-associated protein Cas7/Csd2 [Methylobacterium sp.]|uniref:type I-C CRISPR-associated protein Cas7/Csd2 n=1 Tax=Methylobacterium sp. TaxID=409 RepID=UPI0025D3AE65|nr:type I-C CRISPR-associated protein Cas7/Csd2 [Methylobacterium sp.]MBY0256937.1 type I-C CRISPR-associated protein Cas7/Csd2 [Methylobacterium sp.]
MSNTAVAAGSGALTRRHDFVLFFDVANGNPNGDPDAGNLPRLDPETNRGLVSDVALKRKIRNYVALARDQGDRHKIYMRDGATLNVEHGLARKAVTPEDTTEKALKALPKDADKARAVTKWMCNNFWDIRAFGAVMTTGVNAGQVRGPVQLTFATSVEPVLPLEIAITRLAATTEKDHEDKGGRTMGRKHIVPYGLYRAHGFVSAALASDGTKGTGFSEDDLALLWEALRNMFEHDRSAARGEMATRRLVVFQHESKLGRAHAHDLFARVTAHRVFNGDRHPVGDPRTGNWPAARSFADYAIEVDREGLPAGVEILEP